VHLPFPGVLASWQEAVRGGAIPMDTRTGGV